MYFFIVVFIVFNILLYSALSNQWILRFISVYYYYYYPRKGSRPTSRSTSTEHVKQHCDGNFPPVFKKDNTSLRLQKLLIAYDDFWWL